VVVNGYGVYNPYCYGDSFLSWNAVQIELLCQPTAVSNKEGVIARGGDYDASILNGAYRVVLDEGNPRILWFRVGEVKKAK